MPDEKRQSRALSSRINTLNDRLDDVYKSTYSIDNGSRDAFDSISSDIYDSVSQILANNTDFQGLPDIAQLYTRLERKSGSGRIDREVFGSLIDLFNDGNLMNTLMANPEINRYIKSKDLQIDMVLKYMPKLKTALEIKKDSVLSAENFSKSFLHVRNPAAKDDDDEEDVFIMQAKQLIKKYDLENRFEDMYDDASKYGEQFVYCVPYKKAFETLSRERQRQQIDTSSAAPMMESVILESGRIHDMEDRKFFQSADKDSMEGQLLEQLKGINTTVKVRFNDSYSIPSAIKEAYDARNVINKVSKHSIHESYLNEANTTRKSRNNQENKGKPIGTDRISPRAAKFKLDKIAPDDLEYSKLYDKANDGLMVDDISDPLDGKIEEMPGCVVKKLGRSDVIPIYIEDVCMGYYYFEFSYAQNEDIDRSRMLLNDTFETISNRDMSQNNDGVIRYIASKISKQIDTHFINANQDLKEEIYAILKYDQRFNSTYDSNIINVTFLPPQDVFHFYFKLDDILHRGISDLEDGLLSAMFWVLLSLSTTMGTVTRSYDHRAIYVRQNVESNIAKTLMNVINQLKKGNMGIRQMQSMNNILGIIGRYNDYIIPVPQSGESPIDFQTIPGQEIKSPEELLNRFEENAVNSTDVPMEMVNTVYNVDYATRFTMANSRFLRKVLKRQEICQNRFTEFFMRLYNYEFLDTEIALEIKLPEPIFLNTVNGLAMLNNVRDYVAAIVEIAYPDGVEVDDRVKGEFKRKYTENMLAEYIDLKLIRRIQDEITVDEFSDKFKTFGDTTEGEEGSDDDMGGDEEL